MKKNSAKVITQILIKEAVFAIQKINKNTSLLDKLVLYHAGQSKKVMQLSWQLVS